MTDFGVLDKTVSRLAKKYNDTLNQPHMYENPKSRNVLTWVGFSSVYMDKADINIAPVKKRIT